jgi:phosphatidylserine/phosphatidylglycerophosphate/cardiolipin synthase-like enzyme
MEIEGFNVHFTDPTGSLPIKGRRLEGALKDMVYEARESITVVSYSMSTWSEGWFLWEEISEKVSEGDVRLRVFGDRKKQVERLVGRYKSKGARGWSWVQLNDEDSSLFHIKALIVDENIYLGSANFSGLAMSDSAEWGIIARSPDLCRELNRYLNHLVNEGRMEEV